MASALRHSEEFYTELKRAFFYSHLAKDIYQRQEVPSCCNSKIKKELKVNVNQSNTYAGIDSKELPNTPGTSSNQEETKTEENDHQDVIIDGVRFSPHRPRIRNPGIAKSLLAMLQPSTEEIAPFTLEDVDNDKYTTTDASLPFHELLGLQRSDWEEIFGSEPYDQPTTTVTTSLLSKKDAREEKN